MSLGESTQVEPALTAPNAGMHFNSAKSALFSALSTLVFPDPQLVPTSAFVYLLGLLGFEERAARQAVRRAADAGWIEAQRSGRRSLWQLSSSGVEMMNDGAAHRRRLFEGHRLWDGQVLLLNVAVPESDRGLRWTLKTRLAWVGFAQVSPGAWMSTRLSDESQAAALLGQLGLHGISYVARAGGIGDLRDVVSKAWDLVGLAARYQQLLDDFAGAGDEVGDDSITMRVQLVHRYRRFLGDDPTLPIELLPGDWVGQRMAHRYLELMRQWHDPVRSRWQEILDGKC